MTMTMGDDDGDGHDDLLSNNIVILLIAMGSAAFFVSMYHVIAICLSNQRNQNPPQPPPPASASSSVVHLIPTHTYRKNKAYRVVQGQPNTINNDDHDTCVVCLGDFEEGEELRTMPECMHSFHVACIDTWLSSHWSCPICRSSATPSAELEVLHSEHDFNYQQRIDVTQIELEIQRLRLIGVD